jgi:hypothetical protein
VVLALGREGGHASVGVDVAAGIASGAVGKSRQALASNPIIITAAAGRREGSA